MTAREIPRVLDPLSSSSLNKLHEPAQPPSKKRKTETDTAAGQLATTSIIIRAHAASLSDEPLALDPIAALPRSRLPLSWLENASWSHSDAQPGGLFVADIPALENDLRGCAEPTVLAVRLAANGGLYVIERVKRCIYSLSRLARWVREGDIVVAVKGWQAPRDVGMNFSIEDETAAVPDALNWWQAAQIEEPNSDLGLGKEFGGLQVAVVFGPPEGENTAEESSFMDVLQHRSQSIAPVSNGWDSVGGPSAFLDSQGSAFAEVMDVDVVEPDVKQSPEELLNGMRDHYLQALYISKTSVAYFAKGPLTRCRNAFQNTGSDECRTAAPLAEFYREAILAAKKMDLKYRETLPTSVRDALLALSDGDSAPGSKKLTSKRKKIGRNGLYPEEDGFIRKWWKDRTLIDASGQGTSREAETKRHISDLRLRETQLQILLILEVMALESTLSEAKKLAAEKTADGEANTPKRPRAKKPQDLNVLLELHLDRLCIWHAVGLEESTAADSAKASSFNDGALSGKKVESDAVRDFCTEVIVPFYAARLPDKCKLITRKFGVSGGISPAAKKSQKKDRVEPGSEVKRQPPAPKSRRSLQRVLTDEKAAVASQSRHPPLSRSNTAPSKQETKRDPVEPLLPTMLSGSVRGGIQQAKRVGNREIDLNAVARQHESKLRKVQMLVDQKKELDAAIHAIRKPNRELVAKDITEDVMDRTSRGGASSRKPKNPVRNPLGEGVQVMATPRGSRKKDAVVGLPPLPRSLKASRSFAGEMQDSSPRESPVMIPSSGSMRRAISFSGPDADPFGSRRSANRNQNKRKNPPDELGSIHETPSRPPSKLLSDDKSDAASARRPSSSAGKGKSLFRVPDLPAPRSTGSSNQLMVPSTPVASRHKNIPPSANSSSQHLANSPQGATSSAVMETPPRPAGMRSTPPPRSAPSNATMKLPIVSRSRDPSPPVILGTPVKEAAVVPVTPEKAQTKSIYEQLGWEDDGMEL